MANPQTTSLFAEVGWPSILFGGGGGGGDGPLRNYSKIVAACIPTLLLPPPFGYFFIGNCIFSAQEN